MSLKRVLNKGIRHLGLHPYQLLDKFFTPLDRGQIRRTNNIRLIPDQYNRRGGKSSYAEWAHVVGIFQTLIYLQLPNKNNNFILDVGCGTNILAIASEPLLGDKGKYVGIDVMKKDIDFCRGHYPAPRF